MANLWPSPFRSHRRPLTRTAPRRRANPAPSACVAFPASKSPGQHRRDTGVTRSSSKSQSDTTRAESADTPSSYVSSRLETTQLGLACSRAGRSKEPDATARQRAPALAAHSASLGVSPICHAQPTSGARTLIEVGRLCLSAHSCGRLPAQRLSIIAID
jgi:hypothetical protein